MGKCVMMIPSAMFALVASSFAVIGCGRAVTVTVVEDPNSSVASVSVQDATDATLNVTEIAEKALTTAPAASDQSTEGSAVQPGVNETSASDEIQPSTDSKADNQDAKKPKSSDKTAPDRIKGLGQFGGGGMGGGGMGGGGMGGGMMGGGGMGGGGMGGMMGGGMGGGGGVSIDPKIQLKNDSSGKLDQRRKEATGNKPSKGGFSSD